MQRLLLTAAGVVLTLALFSCGAGSSSTPSMANGSVRLSAALLPEYSVQAEGVVLSLSGPDDAVVLSAAGLDNTKALYGRITYDPARQHFSGNTQLADEVLFIAFDDPQRGFVEFGAVVPNFDIKPGVNGNLTLAQFNFQAGAAQVNKAASSAPDLDPEDSITLSGTIDANNIPSLTWRESLTGDCDNNGEVNIGDFTPFGIHFRKNPDPVDPADSEVRDCDFNRDGEVAIGDVQKMGQNFRKTLGGYYIRTGSTATNLADFEQLERAVLFPTPARQDGEEVWNWTGAAALTADTFYQVEPYDRDNADRGLASSNNVLLQPTLTVTYTDISISFVGQPAWPSNRIAGNGDYIVIVTENTVDGTTGNAEPFATESLQLVITAETDDAPGVPVDITNLAYMGLSEGGGLANVSLASATRGVLSFKDRGRITVQTFAPGDFTLADEISFQLMTIDSLAIVSGSGASPVNIGSGNDVTFTVTGTFDFDTDTTNGNEVDIDLTDFCNWGLLPDAGNTGAFNFRTDTAALETDNANIGDSANVVAEFPNTDDILLFDNRKRSTTPFVVNVN